MPRIRAPKPFTELVKTHGNFNLFSHLDSIGPTDSKGRYLPWEKFIRRPLPNDLSQEQAWLVTKMVRRAQSKTLQLDATQNQSFSYCTPESLVAQLHHIDKLCGGGQAIGENSFMSTKDKNHYLVKSLLMEEAITSSQLEGAVTTRKVAKQMLKENRVPQNKSEQMIFNNYLLMKKALERKDEELSVDLMLELHQIATLNAIDNDATPCEFRTDNDVMVTNLYNDIAYDPPCFSILTVRVNQLCEFINNCHEGIQTNDFIHPLVKAIILHFMIGFIHPFGDGNGRTARALFYWSMLKADYWLFEYVSISKLIQQKRSDYDAAFIYTETDEFDLTYFIYHQVDVVSKAVNALNQHIKNKKTEYYQFMQWIEQSPIANRLKRGQLELLKEAVKQPGKLFTARQVAVDYDINENTARTYLNLLTDHDLLLKTNSSKGKTVTYVSPAGLREKLGV